MFIHSKNIVTLTMLSAVLLMNTAMAEQNLDTLAFVESSLPVEPIAVTTNYGSFHTYYLKNHNTASPLQFKIDIESSVDYATISALRKSEGASPCVYSNGLYTIPTDSQCSFTLHFRGSHSIGSAQNIVITIPYSYDGEYFGHTIGTDATRYTVTLPGWKDTHLPVQAAIIPQESLAVSPVTGDIYVGVTGNSGTGDSSFVYQLSGNQWHNLTAVNNPFTGGVHGLDIGPDNVLFVGSQHSGLYTSIDEGKNWVATSEGLSPKLRTVAVVADKGATYAKSVNNLYRVFAGTSGYPDDVSGVFKLSKHLHWSNVVSEANVHSIDAGHGYIYAGTYGSDVHEAGVWSAKNNGDYNEWRFSNVGIGNSDIHAVAVAPNGDVFAGTNNASGMGVLFKSTDQGKTWTAVNIETDYVSSLAIVKNMDSYDIYAGTSQGIHHSTNEGYTWHPYNKGLVNPNPAALNVSTVAIKSTGADNQYVVYMGSYGAGVLTTAH